MKDLDWIDEGKKIKIGSDRAKLFKDQLKKDTYWLRQEKIMDYSLLVGIHYRDRAKQPASDNIANVVLDHSMYNKLQTVDENKENDEEVNAAPQAITPRPVLSEPNTSDDITTELSEIFNNLA